MTAQAETDGFTLVEIGKNARDCIRVRICSFKGTDYADVRVFFKGDDGERRPTAKGVALRTEMLPEVIAALQEAQRRLSDGAV